MFDLLNQMYNLISKFTYDFNYFMQPKNKINILGTILKYIITMPLIWIVIIPVLITDLFLEIYHRICFPILGINIVKRSEYIRIIDRAKLPYLNWFEKLGCAYCGYVNGWLHYASVIAGRTESYFAP